jgi:hypothetical protein
MPPPKSRIRRDTLGRLCFAVHLAALLFIVLGWASPARDGLLAYLVFLPLMVLHWKFNRDTCILNNLENWLRHRRWRAPEANAEEGAWLKTLIRDTTGIALSPGQMNLVIYGTMTLLWTLALLRFVSFQGA